MLSNTSPLLIFPNFSNGEYIQITPQSAQWDFLHFAARGIKRGNKRAVETHENELGLLIPGGIVQVTSSRCVLTIPLNVGLIGAEWMGGTLAYHLAYSLDSANLVAIAATRSLDEAPPVIVAEVEG
jgi:hypothetical protein